MRDEPELIETKRMEAFDLEAGQPDHVTIEKHLDGTYHATPFVEDATGYTEMGAWFAFEHDDEAIREVREKSTVVGDIVFERNWVEIGDEEEPV